MFVNRGVQNLFPGVIGKDGMNERGSGNAVSFFLVAMQSLANAQRELKRTFGRVHLIVSVEQRGSGFP